MKFLDPQKFWLLLGIPVIAVFYLAAFRAKKKAFARFGNTEMLKKLTRSTSFFMQKLKAFFIITAYFFLVMALARPAWGVKTRIVPRKANDIIVLLDVSTSMMASDIKPSRLMRAKKEISEFIERLSGDRVGIMVFAGKSIMQCPLTADYGAAKMFLDAVDEDIVPQAGTDLEGALRAAANRFSREDLKHRIILLVTDGEAHEGDPAGTAEKLSEEGVIIYSIGIGSPEGGPISINKNGRTIYKKDKEGSIVMSRLDEKTLMEISAASGGKYFRAASSGLPLDRITKDISELEKAGLEGKDFSRYRERYAYFLFVAFIFIVAEFTLSDKKKAKGEYKGRFE
ncbi:MAG: vWA domain-containing protein [Fibrobacterota bacterium]